jgi:hypothetical protein
MMPVDPRDAWVRAYLEDVFNGHNVQSLDKYMTENLVSHWLGGAVGQVAYLADSKFQTGCGISAKLLILWWARLGSNQ